MLGNVKFIGDRNPEEKAPEKDDIESIREAIHHVRKKKFVEPKPVSVEDVLKRIDNDWRFGKLGALVWTDNANTEKVMKGFKADEELTRSMRIMIRRIGRDILSKDEMKEAEERFIAAGHSYKVTGSGGKCLEGRIMIFEGIFELQTPLALNYLKSHEPAHYVHSFIRMKQLESGKIEDPIVKKLYERMHQFYSNDSIWRMEAMYTGDYWEKIADAISLNVLMGANDKGATYFRRLRGDAVWLENLLHQNPKKFRELMEKPSLWVEAGSVERLVEKLARE
jgi:hypothetical protein